MKLSNMLLMAGGGLLAWKLLSKPKTVPPPPASTSTTSTISQKAADLNTKVTTSAGQSTIKPSTGGSFGLGGIEAMQIFGVDV